MSQQCESINAIQTTKVQYTIPTTDKLIEYQNLDPYTQAIIRYLKHKELPQDDKLARKILLLENVILLR